MKKFVLEDLRSNVNITVQHEVEHNPTEVTHNDCWPLYRITFYIQDCNRIYKTSWSSNKNNKEHPDWKGCSKKKKRR